MGNRIFTSDIEITGDLNVSGTITGGGSGPSANLLTKITWQALKTKRDEGNLIPGMKYQITDYMTTTSQENTRSAGHQFDIIVEALGESELSEDAKAISHEGNDYFKTSREYVESAEWVSPMPSVEDIEILYNLQDDHADADYVHESAKVITQLTTHLSEDGIEVPAMFNPDPEASHYKNTLITTYYIINDSDEVVYDGERNNDVIVDFIKTKVEEGSGDTPELLLYKTDVRDYSIDEVDYDDYFKYIGDVEFEGTTYNKWQKYDYDNEAGKTVPSDYYILTNIVVVDNNFTFTKEEFDAAIQYVQQPSDYDCYYIYAGTYSMSQTVNTLVSEQYTMYEDDDEVIYGPGQYHPEDIFIKIGYTDVDGVNTPVMYKTDYDDPDLIEEGPDYGDPFLYQGDFELNGVTYNMWLKQLQGYRILTQVIVVNNQFTITQEQLEAAIQTTTITYDKWQEYTVALGYNDTTYHLTNHFVDATMGTKVDDPVRSWQLKYCLDNDSRRFGWADASIGKGIVYYLKDDVENECSYDFKNIQFYVNTYEIQNALYNDPTVDMQWLYTFALKYYDQQEESWKWCKDGTVHAAEGDPGEEVDKSHHNKISFLNNYSAIPVNVFLFDHSCIEYITLEHDCTNNYFGNECHNMILKQSCYGNRMERSFYNILQEYCSSIYFTECSYNDIGANSNGIIINNGSNNKFGESCNNNTLYISSGTIMGCDCDNIHLEQCNNNTFGANCYNIRLNNCWRNNFAGQDRDITMGSECHSNTFAVYCANITFSERCTDNIFRSEVYDVTFERGCSFNEIETSSGTISLGSASRFNYIDGNRISAGMSFEENNIQASNDLEFSPNCMRNSLTRCSNIKLGTGEDDYQSKVGIIIDWCYNLYIHSTTHLYNIHIHKGVHGSSEDNKKDLSFTETIEYPTDIYPNNSKTIILDD